MFLLILVTFALLLQLIFFGSPVPLCVGDFPFGLLHGSSRYFSRFLFCGFRVLPSFSVGLVHLFLLLVLVLHLYAFFLFGFVFLRRGPLSGSLFSSSSGSSLGQVCPGLGVLAGVLLCFL